MDEIRIRTQADSRKQRGKFGLALPIDDIRHAQGAGENTYKESGHGAILAEARVWVRGLTIKLTGAPATDAREKEDTCPGVRLNAMFRQAAAQRKRVADRRATCQERPATPRSAERVRELPVERHVRHNVELL